MSEHLSIEASTFWELVEARASITPDLVVIVDEHGRTVTAAGYRAAAERAAAGFVVEGVRAGDTVAWQMPTWIVHPDEPPAKGELTAGQVDRFLAVQARVHAELGDRWTELEKKADALKKKADEKGSDFSFSDFTSVFSDFTGIYMQARKAHVNALNIHKFSDEEFSWVRMRVYEAAGMQLAGSIDTSAIQQMAKESARQGGVTLPDVAMPDVPEANTKLVKPHVAKLKEWLPMAMLGL